MNDAHSLDEIDVRKFYTPNMLSRVSGIPARTIREARDLPRLHVDSWNRINGADFLEWLAAKRTLPEVPDREAEVRARAREAVRAEQRLSPTG